MPGAYIAHSGNAAFHCLHVTEKKTSMNLLNDRRVSRIATRRPIAQCTWQIKKSLTTRTKVDCPMLK